MGRFSVVSTSLAGNSNRVAATLENPIDDPVIHGGLAAHEVVTVGVQLDLFDRLTGVFGQNAVQALTRLQTRLSGWRDRL